MMELVPRQLPRPFFVVCIWNERCSAWVELMSSFNPERCRSLLPYLDAGGVVACIATCADDSDDAIACVVDVLKPPVGSFAAEMDEHEKLLEELNRLKPVGSVEHD